MTGLLSELSDIFSDKEAASDASLEEPFVGLYIRCLGRWPSWCFAVLLFVLAGSIWLGCMSPVGSAAILVAMFSRSLWDACEKRNGR